MYITRRATLQLKGRVGIRIKVRVSNTKNILLDRLLSEPGRCVCSSHSYIDFVTCSGRLHKCMYKTHTHVLAPPEPDSLHSGVMGEARLGWTSMEL